MYDHYISLEWAQTNMVLARMTKESSEVKTFNATSNLKDLQLCLSRLKGRKILTFEETTTAQWLYVELKECVDEILICDPYRNRLLSEGAKTDKLDAIRLVQLLRAGLLKPVFHSAGRFIELRKFVSGYEDLVKLGVRLKNQRASLFRAQGRDKRQKNLDGTAEQFVLEGTDRGIGNYEAEKKRYEEQMGKFRRKHGMIRALDQISGIGLVGAIKIAARVVDPRRFSTKGQWLSYCGLIRHEKLSGGRSYGWKGPRYCRTLKSVFKTAAITVIEKSKENFFKDYYHFLIQQKGYAEHQARHATARRIAVVAWGVLKSGKGFDAEKLAQNFKR
ncbi:MAG: transposase [Candidatus Omnitrophica bacterium]|nr:transposase [Candidatus Omnitrophota bacterium]